MASILCLRLGVAGTKEQWKTLRAPILSRPNACKPIRLAFTTTAPWQRSVLCFPIFAASSDLGDPERLTGEDYYTEFRYDGGGSGNGSDFEGDSFEQSHGSLGDKLEAANQLSESVPSSSVDRLEESGGDDDDENPGGRGGGDGGGGSGKGGDGAGGDSEDNKKKLSASQKLTLAYAFLVGVGGLIGYAKSKSVKSLASGVVSSLVLYYVYTQLPTNPVFASSLGLGISGLLLGVMGARFKRSGKVFPAGVVSFVSLIMTGGYIHGIVRSSHT